MAGRDDLIDEYNQEVMIAATRDQKAPTPTAFMLGKFKGTNEVTYRGRTYYTSYTNPDSARRAFRHLQEGRAGTKLAERARYYAVPQYQRKKGEKHESFVGYKMEPNPRGGFYNTYRVFVQYHDVDENGDAVSNPKMRSFYVQDINGTADPLRTSVIEQALGDEIERRIVQWETIDSPVPGGGGAEDYYVEAVWIEATTTYNVPQGKVFDLYV